MTVFPRTSAGLPGTARTFRGPPVPPYGPNRAVGCRCYRRGADAASLAPRPVWQTVALALPALWPTRQFPVDHRQTRGVTARVTSGGFSWVKPQPRFPVASIWR